MLVQSLALIVFAASLHAANENPPELPDVTLQPAPINQNPGPEHRLLDILSECALQERWGSFLCSGPFSRTNACQEQWRLRHHTTRHDAFSDSPAPTILPAQNFEAAAVFREEKIEQKALRPADSGLRKLINKAHGKCQSPERIPAF